MYQVGLVGFIQDKQLSNSYGLMRRAMIRMHRLTGSDKPMSSLWWLTNVTLSAMSDCEMEALETRKMVFSRIDRVAISKTYVSSWAWSVFLTQIKI